VKKVYFGIMGQYGDIVMQEPALRQYIKENPEDKITIGCSLKYAAALKLYDDYHKNIVARKIFLDYSDFPTEDDVRYFKNENFDLVTIKRDSNTIEITDTDKLAQHPDPNWALNIHQTEAAGRQQNIEVKESQIKFENKFEFDVREQYICFSIFPGYPQGGVKSFSEEQIRGVVSLINKLGYKAIHLNGPNEPDIPGSVKLNKDWLTSVAVITKSKLLITGDTGMSWAASGFQHPTIGLYAWGYNPIVKTSKNWQPVNINATYLEAKTVNQIKPKEIIQVVVEKLKDNNK
jgi:hypothetical protein